MSALVIMENMENTENNSRVLLFLTHLAAALVFTYVIWALVFTYLGLLNWTKMGSRLAPLSDTRLPIAFDLRAMNHIVEFMRGIPGLGLPTGPQPLEIQGIPAIISWAQRFKVLIRAFDSEFRLYQQTRDAYADFMSRPYIRHSRGLNRTLAEEHRNDLDDMLSGCRSYMQANRDEQDEALNQMRMHADDFYAQLESMSEEHKTVLAQYVRKFFREKRLTQNWRRDPAPVWPSN
ncbi:uncharacterized protein B0I36DRAFT_369275 [Microdochium trichocladiopsis]|uniref:Uncharacterized protein n=1 Tax=Microdochium trichocladiopsis TaxID=1682393 RepID=A0A9P8XRX6_9PEZI|nr:uncharacterized protein B0I36DRAFT_369275 [Microdochium trichocladiopsis]KAH7014304.1 hypothetical protein B0I36DRAFT_369275 [Microdochium trichocladiopsis]